MRRKLLVALVLSLTLGIAGVANAALITEVVGINRYLWGNGYVSWHFNVDPDFTVPYDTVNSANLTIRGYNINGNNDYVYIEENLLPLGTLATGISSFSSFGLTQYFQLGWGPSNGTFDVTLLFNHDTFGYMILNNSTLTIDYTNHDPPGGGGAVPAPEPGTLVLVGTGLIGLAGWSRKKFLK